MIEESGARKVYRHMVFAFADGYRTTDESSQDIFAARIAALADALLFFGIARTCTEKDELIRLAKHDAKLLLESW